MTVDPFINQSKQITSNDFVSSTAPPSIGNDQLCSEHHEPVFPQSLVPKDVQIDFAAQVRKQTRNVGDVALKITPNKRYDTFYQKCFFAKHAWPSKSS